jgi:hypothetical protein
MFPIFLAFLPFPEPFPPENFLGQKLKFNAAIIAAKIIPDRD